MEYSRFGRTDLMVSRLCLGTAPFGKQTEEKLANQILDKATEAGITFLDTANVYPMGAEDSLVGRTEEIIGRWLKGKRNRFIIATKAGGKMGPAAWDQGASRSHLLNAIDASLQRLGTDYVDLYQLHFDDPKTPLDETLEALSMIVRSGKARYIGASNILANRLACMLSHSDSLQIERFASVQPRYNLLFREIERDILPLARAEDLAVIPFNPLAGGMLTGKYQFDTIPADGRFTPAVGRQMGEIYRVRYWHKRKFETIEKLREVADQTGAPLTSLAIAWILSHSQITSVIIGASRPDQISQNLAAIDLKIESGLKAELDEITSEYS
jgi:1-deoxyxylulose-5-phosphate synthase